MSGWPWVEIAGWVFIILAVVILFVTRRRANDRYRGDVAAKASQLLDQHLAAAGGHAQASNTTIVQTGGTRYGADHVRTADGADYNDVGAIHYDEFDDLDFYDPGAVALRLRDYYLAGDVGAADRLCDALRQARRDGPFDGTARSPVRDGTGVVDGGADRAVLGARAAELSLPRGYFAPDGSGRAYRRRLADGGE